MWRIFDEYGQSANKEHAALKCSASELLGLYGMFRHFVETRLPDDPRVHGERTSFLLIAKAVDIILLAKRHAIPLHEAGVRLREALSAHLEHKKRTQGNGRVVPKTHWAFDISDFMCVDDILYDCFVVERLHLRAKKVAQHVLNLKHYERSVLSGVINGHVALLRETSAIAQLVGRSAPFPGFGNCRVADRAELSGFRLRVDDFVFRGSAFGKVRACCEDHDELYAIVDELQLVTEMSPHSNK